jgi:predicted DNA-binding ribbon-helix-helix protein
MRTIAKATRGKYHGAHQSQMARGAATVIRKTMRIGEVRTSIKLEPEFWGYLKEVAEGRGMRLSSLINEVARATPERTNLASTLRTFALIHAKMRWRAQQEELQRLTLSGNSNDLIHVVDACPLPALVLDAERAIRHVNHAFSMWLNLDENGVRGQRLDNIMILRGAGIREMWAALLEGRVARAGFNATYVSPGKVRTAQAMAVALARSSDARGLLVLFETLSGRS